MNSKLNTEIDQFTANVFFKFLMDELQYNGRGQNIATRILQSVYMPYPFEQHSQYLS